jgi:transcription elongation factor GreA
MIKEMDTLEEKKKFKLRQEFAGLSRNKKLDPDYVVWFDELTFIKKRISEIKNILKNALLITHHKNNENIVELGSKVTIEDEEKKETMVFQIVDSPEVNPTKGKISKNSPLGAAMIGKKIKEKFFVSHPVNKNYLIKSIEYIRS